MSTLEYIGYSTGYRLIERLTREMQRFKDELDTMKFICTDFWVSIYKKQIDNLRTNHQGVYVLQDNAFRFLTKLSANTQYLEHAPMVGFNIFFFLKMITFEPFIFTVCCVHLWLSTWQSRQFRHQQYGHCRSANDAIMQISHSS